MNRLLQNLRDHNDKKFIKISSEASRDIAWFTKFVDKFNGRSIFIKDKVDHDIHLDACPKGVGAIFQNFVYQARFLAKMAAWDIATLEMMNILMALRQRKQDWEAKSIEIFCDNLAVVTVLQTGRTRDKILGMISRNIFMLAAKFDIYLKVSHVPGKKNIITDLLSRWENLDIQKQTLQKLVPSGQWVHLQDHNFDLDEKI